MEQKNYYLQQNTKKLAAEVDIVESIVYRNRQHCSGYVLLLENLRFNTQESNNKEARSAILSSR